MKRVWAVILTLCVAWSLAACGASGTPKDDAAASDTESVTESVNDVNGGSGGEEETKSVREPVPDTVRPRVIVTTDLECDDMNSLIHMALFFNELDMDGIVYSASQYHFIGDGEHTLGEINPNFCCLDENAASLTSYRPMEMGWIENLWNNEYAEVYPFLKENDPRYPAPEELLSVTKVGNVEFEGDVRAATEGSDLIKDAMLDDDPRPLYVMSWGGFNTVARALLSVAEEYRETDQWDDIYKKVTDKTVVCGYTQDMTYRDYIHELYPDLVLMSATDSYGSYFAAQTSQADVIDMFKSDWMKENIKFNHGALMEKYGLFGDGTYYEGETPENQFGEVLVIDWGWGFAYYYDPYDFLGEGDSISYIPLLDFGLRGLENPAGTTMCGKVSYTTEGDLRSFSEMVMDPAPVETVGYNPVTGAASNDSGRYIKAYQEEFAARADWCVNAYEDCNHAPIVTVEESDAEAAPGQVVKLNASVRDPDGDDYTAYWWVDEQYADYSGDSKSLQVWDPVSASTFFTVPADAAAGDRFCLTLQARDKADAPMTRYAQVIVTVTE